MREAYLVAGRHDGRLDLVADGDAQLALRVGQLGALDPRFALAPDVDEDVLGVDVDETRDTVEKFLKTRPLGYPVLMGTAFLAYSLGLRHAVDADHIAAIGPGLAAIEAELATAGKNAA